MDCFTNFLSKMYTIIVLIINGSKVTALNVFYHFTGYKFGGSWVAV